MTLRRGPARRVAIAGVVGALYVVLSLIVAPLAYGPLQFRLGEVLKPLVIKYPVTIPAFAVGVGLVNLFSPVAGGLELILMPAVNLVGGVLCWFVARRVGGDGRDVRGQPALRPDHRGRRGDGAALRRRAALPRRLRFGRGLRGDPPVPGQRLAGAQGLGGALPGAPR